MSNIIEDMYYGNLEPQESRTHITMMLKKKLAELTEKEDKLYDSLPNELKKLFAEYVVVYNEFSCLSCLDSFVGGFRYGARFAYDTFVE